MRGCQKRVVYLKNTGSAIFEEAYFVMKEDLVGCESERAFLDEANRIIEENSGAGGKRKKGRIRGSIIPFIIGALVGFLVFCIILIAT